MGTKGQHHYILQGIKALFLLLFVYTATSKLMYLGQFQEQLHRFPFIASYSDWVAIGVPFVELVIAGMFLFPKYQLGALYASFSLLFIFTGYIINVLQFSNAIPCSCGGVVSILGWKGHILFNIAFILLALLGIRLTKKHKTEALHQNTT